MRSLVAIIEGGSDLGTKVEYFHSDDDNCYARMRYQRMQGGRKKVRSGGAGSEVDLELTAEWRETFDVSVADIAGGKRRGQVRAGRRN